ncbi:MAG: transposase [Acidobacteria bacterium]|nr:transposase [Acidobacteriota bacterium]
MAGAQKRGVCFRRIQRKLISADPQRPGILVRIRWRSRHLPADGVLLFFDVKPVVVKAYGGGRYTSANRVVLEKRQKTRGRFYVFLLYDVHTGKVHWAFYPSKDSRYVCRFLRRIRHWYAQQPVWLVLDQDPAHPCKSRHTRRTMRALQLHWISLPKGSPDDNPVEALFSDIQQSILDTSNDADAPMTKQRISAHLRGRCRRKNRRIHISYLPDSHKIR